MFNENSIKLKISLMSDMHVSGSWFIEGSMNKMKKAFEYTKEVAGKYPEIYLFNGDFVDCINSRDNVIYWPEEDGSKYPKDYETAYKIQTAKEFENWRELFALLPESSDIIYCLGNHDSDNNNNNPRFIKEFASKYEVGDNLNFERMYRTDTDIEGLKTGMRHCVSHGYHFFALDMYSDMQKSLEFLKKGLDEVTAAEPDKYVFVLWHCKVPNTVFCDHGWGSSKELGELLKNYPQVLLITGHTHCPLQNERSIMQNAFTTVEASCVDYIVEASVLDHEEREKPLNFLHNEAYMLSHGLLLEIDNEDNIRITRLDYAHGEIIKQPWILPHPAADLSHLTHYTARRAALYPAPEFPCGTQIELVPDEKGTKIKFRQAQHPDMPFLYAVKITLKSGEEIIHRLTSRFLMYATPSKENLPDIEAVLPIDFESVKSVTVTPQDIWYQSGKSIVMEL